MKTTLTATAAKTNDFINLSLTIPNDESHFESDEIYLNGKLLTAEQIQLFKKLANLSVLVRRYWLNTCLPAAKVLLDVAANHPGNHDVKGIFLNGEPLTTEQVQLFYHLVGTFLSNGRYWLDIDMGLWGYGDSPWYSIPNFFEPKKFATVN